MVMAVTSIVTVTVPPEAIVTEPVNTPPTRLKLAVLALVELFTLLDTRASVLVNWLGKVSLMLLVNVDGPAFVTTRVKLVVAPWATVVEPTSLVTPRLTTLVTVPATVALVLPLLVVPAGISTVNVLV